MPAHPSNPVNAEGVPLDVPRLVQQAKGGDEVAFGELMQAYYPRVCQVLIGMVRNQDDVRDLSQQVWIKVWNKLHTFKGDADFFTWLYRVTTFAGLDYIRKRNRRREVEIEDSLEPERNIDALVPPSLTAQPDQMAMTAEVRQTFDEALAALSADHRTALILREVEGMSYDEIATVMRCRRGTVMSRIFYARQAVQEKMRRVR